MLYIVKNLNDVIIAEISLTYQEYIKTYFDKID